METSRALRGVSGAPKMNTAGPSSFADQSSPTTSVISVTNLARTTSSVDLKLLLVQSIDYKLIKKTESTKFASTVETKVSLHHPIPIVAAQSFDGRRIRVRGEDVATSASSPEGPRYASSSSAYPQEPPAPQQRSKKRSREPSPSPPRNRRISHPTRDVFSLNSSCVRQPPPPPDATQKELDEWAEEAFERRFPADQEQLLHHWVQGRSDINSWRG